ncbi:MAG: CDP-diacylglycerol--glycerol-3-phosphate 3-phosphatidyltransferase [Methylomonas sp.]|nr:CDP-diacylglycerol--glycerol-3-phosphate 3-phosphatidyltransferase [Methylomonas sp.]PPD20502.1 MAG: CDP-diacylglycerol--glycerol-3-phosphate 3-phosphatidyltransferase [Methylomonas sp.]PPD26819.1 MAG: CDP-diacylglycerol--glycerol-3-phosphate 3-phosphatidyltransferase [Methylomonas sp.]PPD38683.1 MAG: CDP-diacylglycerol--glycerol-3-phosphate 3-phosphatidyltransferase [Methylomonas sp.]PPD40816.1 MAG: CDP-diacylglycerol--glycerol-3-phosphate 3-phosphatidyltransferase [Methylomonas sp.]
MAVKFTLPTYLTLLRIALIPLLAVVFYLPWDYARQTATAIFIFAAVTDWLDGYLARKMGLETRFGAFLDPVADKLMVAFILVLIVQAEASPWLAIPSAVIIGREITIASLREWMAEIGQRTKVKVSQLGKWKTSAQMTAISFLLYHDDVFNLPINTLGYWLLYLSAVLTLWSMVNYLVVALSSFSD